MEDIKIPRGGQPIEKVRKIFKQLHDGPMALTTLSKAVGMNYQTCVAYIDMILEIQAQPRIEKISSGKTTLVRLPEEYTGSKR